MNRRRFLGGALAAVALGPAFIRRAFADASYQASGGPGMVELAAAYGRALSRARPLLVFVVPKDDGQKRERGNAYGEYLNNVGDDELAPLAQAEVVCAGMDDLRRLVPSAGDGEPLLVLVTIDGAGPTVRRLDATLPRYGFRDPDEQADAVIDRRIRLLADWVGRALPLDRAQPTRVAALADEAKRDLRVHPPAGARWARSSGCGTLIEGERNDSGPRCGMGHVPRKSARFLYLFSRT